MRLLLPHSADQEINHCGLPLEAIVSHWITLDGYPDYYIQLNHFKVSFQTKTVKQMDKQLKTQALFTVIF